VRHLLIKHEIPSYLEATRSKQPVAFRLNDDLTDLSDVAYRPMPLLAATEPNQDINECLREAMSISVFQGTTSRFIDQLIAAGWILAKDRMSHGLLNKNPGLTRNGAFALAIFTLQLQEIVDDATDQDEFYFQFGNAMRYRQGEEVKKLKTYIYHFLKGLESMPKYNGTLWRGVRGDFAKAAPKNFQQFSIINFNGYSSASPNREVAQQFVGGKGLLLKFINVENSARDVREISAYPDEEERTILAGTQWIVVKEAHKAWDGTLEIWLKEGKTKQA